MHITERRKALIWWLATPTKREGLSHDWLRGIGRTDSLEDIEWQLEIGRAFLDYPDLDRPAIARRMKELQGLKDDRRQESSTTP